MAINLEHEASPLGLVRPYAPVCGVNFNSSLGGSFYPTANNATAGEQHRMFAARVDNSQFQITFEWRGRHFVLPHRLSPTRKSSWHA